MNEKHKNYPGENDIINFNFNQTFLLFLILWSNLCFVFMIFLNVFVQIIFVLKGHVTFFAYDFLLRTMNKEFMFVSISNLAKSFSTTETA